MTDTLQRAERYQNAVVVLVLVASGPLTDTLQLAERYQNATPVVVDDAIVDLQLDRPRR